MHRAETYIIAHLDCTGTTPSRLTHTHTHTYMHARTHAQTHTDASGCVTRLYQYVAKTGRPWANRP